MEQYVPIIAEMVVPMNGNINGEIMNTEMPIVNIKSNRNTMQEQDNQFMQIQELIHQKREMLKNNQRKIGSISKQNHFLENIKQDYSKYFHYIQKQKNDQMQALRLLDKYIHDLTVSGKLSEQNVEDAKVEQANILKELDTIKHDLDSMIDE
jgi:hypothetical protein